MTREEAIVILETAREQYANNCIKEAFDMAITSLKEETICPILSDDEVKQPCIKSPCGIERPHGEWIDVNGDGSLWECSNCNETSCCRGNFCPDCGSDNRPRKHGCPFADEECKKNPCKDCGLKEGE